MLLLMSGSPLNPRGSGGRGVILRKASCDIERLTCQFLRQRVKMRELNPSAESLLTSKTSNNMRKIKDLLPYQAAAEPYVCVDSIGREECVLHREALRLPILIISHNASKRLIYPPPRDFNCLLFVSVETYWAHVLTLSLSFTKVWWQDNQSSPSLKAGKKPLM